MVVGHCHGWYRTEYTYHACHDSALDAIAMMRKLVEYTINHQIACINDCCTGIKNIVREQNYIDVCKKHLQFWSKWRNPARSPKLGFWPRCQGIFNITWSLPRFSGSFNSASEPPNYLEISNWRPLYLSRCSHKLSALRYAICSAQNVNMLTAEALSNRPRCEAANDQQENFHRSYCCSSWYVQNPICN